MLTVKKRSKYFQGFPRKFPQSGSFSTQGFTLIELMIAVGILSITLAATMSLMEIMSRQNNSNKAQVEANQLMMQFSQYIANPSICSNTFRGIAPGQFITEIALSRNSDGDATSTAMSGLGTSTNGTGGQRFGDWVLSTMRILNPYDAADDTILQNVSTRYGYTPFRVGSPNMTNTGYALVIIELNLRHFSMSSQQAALPGDIGRYGGATKTLYLQMLARFGRLQPIDVLPADLNFPVGKDMNSVTPDEVNLICANTPANCVCNANVITPSGTLGNLMQDNLTPSDARYSVESLIYNGMTFTMNCFGWSLRNELWQCGSASNIVQE